MVFTSVFEPCFFWGGGTDCYDFALGIVMRTLSYVTYLSSTIICNKRSNHGNREINVPDVNLLWKDKEDAENTPQQSLIFRCLIHSFVVFSIS